jgi:hypothetical protein
LNKSRIGYFSIVRVAAGKLEGITCGNPHNRGNNYLLTSILDKKPKISLIKSKIGSYVDVQVTPSRRAKMNWGYDVDASNYDDYSDFYDVVCEDDCEVADDFDYVDESMDGDHDSAMTSCGWGTDEDYGFYGDDEGDFD